MTPHDSLVAQAALERLMIQGGLPSRAVLDPTDIAQRSGLFPEIWHEALHRIAGTGLVDQDEGRGFVVPLASASHFVQMLDWQERLLLLAVDGQCRPMRPMELVDRHVHRQIGQLFVLAAQATMSASHDRAMTLAASKVAPYRTGEPEVFDDLSDEAEALESDLRSGDLASARRAVRSYHDRRRQAAPLLLQSLTDTRAQAPTMRGFRQTQGLDRASERIGQRVSAPSRPPIF